MAYWLFKTEPNEYSIDDLKKEPKGITEWDGIRNYQARNLMRDKVKKGDEVLIYHSACKDVGVVGIAKVVKAAYPDPAQFKRHNKYFDQKSDRDNPRWFCVDIKYVKKFPAVLTLKEIKQMPALKNMVLLKQGRLSIQPVSKVEWNAIIKQGNLK